jgi:hypothetical protein
MKFDEVRDIKSSISSIEFPNDEHVAVLSAGCSSQQKVIRNSIAGIIIFFSTFSMFL